MTGFGPPEILGAWVLDAALGDPRWIPWPHPVVLVGRAVTRLERRLRRPGSGPAGLVVQGLALWAAVVGGSFLAAWVLWSGLGLVHPLLGRAAGVYLAYACLATRELDREARSVLRALRQGRLRAARDRLARIVGRDTGALPAVGVARAAVETVAENASDGVVAPLFYLALGAATGLGPCLAVAYKAVNTLDSMVGYRDERYRLFGRVPARADDLANWMPARLTAALAALAAAFLWGRGHAALRTAWRDSRCSASPNAGWPEAAFAGALGVRLGGPRSYRGVPSPHPWIGADGGDPGPEHIARALRLLWATSALATAVAAVLSW